MCGLTEQQLDELAYMFFSPFSAMQHSVTYDHFLHAFVDPNKTKVTFDSTKYLKQCAPKTCEWIEMKTSDPEHVLLSVQGLLGGASVIVTGAMGLVSRLVNVVCSEERSAV